MAGSTDYTDPIILHPSDPPRPAPYESRGNISLFLARKVLDFLLGGVLYTPVVNMYFALWETPLDEQSDGATKGEVEAFSYTRVLVINNIVNFPEAEGMSKSNGTIVDFPMAEEDWGLISHYGILDSPNIGEGNMLYFGQLVQPKTIMQGDVARFNVGALIFRIVV